jgi:hypothetical protein
VGVSVILYGRNDSHGYNLHKRAAISLNCIAEVLTDDDEILFVDYNTSDLLPTFPEAIQDTLTATAKRRLRVFRVRSPSHARFAGGTHLEVLEPVARNVALRRSNPANRWVLSTNTDMILLPSAGQSLSALLDGLADGFYHLPRFELPEGLWESFDRGDPIAIMAQTGRWASQFHLRQVVYGSPTILYDAPGDFQLALRSDLFAIDGFDEEMIRGWHVDSNLARRMGLRRGRVDSLEDQLTGYHCDHTRQASALHGPDLPRNDSDRFVDGVYAPALPRQAASWGLADETVESFTLLGASPSSLYLKALSAALPEPQSGPARAAYRSDSYNQLDYDWRVALPFLLDALASCPPDQIIGYAGVGRGFLKGLATGLAELLPAARIMALEAEAATGLANVEAVDWAEWQSLPGLFLFEIGQREGESARSSALLSGQVITLFDRLTRSRARGPPTRVIAVNAVHTDFEPVLDRAVSCPPAPFGSRIRQGYLKRPLPQALRQEIDGDARAVDPRLRRWTERFMGGDCTPWSLERAGFLTLLEEGLDLTPGRPGRRVLLACHLAEPLGGMLASIGVDVDFVDPLALLADAGAWDWRPGLAHLSTLAPNPVGSMDETSAYDAVIWPQNALLIRGFSRAAELLRQVHSRLAPQGLLAVTLDTASDQSHTGPAFAAATGYAVVSVPADLPGAPPLWMWRKGLRTDPDFDALAAALGPDFSKPFDVTRWMQAKAWIERANGAWRIGHDTPEGHALYGPYVALPPGQYEANVEARFDEPISGGPLLRLEIAMGPDRVVARTDYAQADLARGSATIAFEATDAEDPMEIRVVHFGRARLTLGQVVLRAVSRK